MNAQPKESDHQAFLFAWIDAIGQHRWPELRWAYAVPNGAWYGGGNRYAQAAKQRAMGLRRGVPDVCVPVVQPLDQYSDYAGLYIEFKRSKSEKLSPEQHEYKHYLTAAGYAWARCDSGQQAVEVVTAYMNGTFGESGQ